MIVAWALMPLANNIGPITDSNGNPIENAGEAGVVQVAALKPHGLRRVVLDH
jgi:hypothetical protein